MVYTRIVVLIPVLVSFHAASTFAAPLPAPSALAPLDHNYVVAMNAVPRGNDRDSPEQLVRRVVVKTKRKGGGGGSRGGGSKSSSGSNNSTSKSSSSKTKAKNKNKNKTKEEKAADDTIVQEVKKSVEHLATLQNNYQYTTTLPSLQPEISDAHRHLPVFDNKVDDDELAEFWETVAEKGADATFWSNAHNVFSSHDQKWDDWLAEHLRRLSGQQQPGGTDNVKATLLTIAAFYSTLTPPVDQNSAAVPARVNPFSAIVNAPVAIANHLKPFRPAVHKAAYNAHKVAHKAPPIGTNLNDID